MENNNSNISRNYNIKLGSSSINNKSKNNYNNSNNSNNNNKKLHGQLSKTIFVTNLYQSDTVDDLYELFSLRSTNYLKNNCHVLMDHFSNVDQPFASATVTASAHFCEELLKIHGIVFHGNPLVIEMSKSPLEQSNHYSQPPLQPPPIQRVINSYDNAVNPRRKDIALFADSIPKGMRMKDLNSRVKGGKIHLKPFPGAKASQLNNYIKPTLEEYKHDCAIIHIGINDILRNKNDTALNNLPESILENANTCQNYNIGKIFISALLPSKRTKGNISQINETLKQLSSRNNFIFVEHENIGFDDLWVDGIHLLNSGKVMLGSNFVSEVNRYLGESDNILGNFMT